MSNWHIFWAKSNRCFRCFLERNGFFFFLVDLRPAFLRNLRTFSGCTVCLVTSDSSWAAITAFSIFPDDISLITFRLAWSDNLCGRPALVRGSPISVFNIRETVMWLTEGTLLATSRQDKPSFKYSTIFVFICCGIIFIELVIDTIQTTIRTIEVCNVNGC